MPVKPTSPFSHMSILSGRIVIAVLLSVFCQANLTAADQAFPNYPSIKNNVSFWEKVYAQYPSTKGFIHDSQDLSIIYEIVDIRKTDQPGARRFNKKKIKKIKSRYRNILLKLAAGHPPQSEAERKVASLYGSKGSREVWRQAADNIRFQTCLKDRFSEGITRSGRYLKEIKSIFRSYGLPTDLAYLPHVESSFNYKAYSKFGAAGIWQFIRSTGRRFMTISYTVDERRDPLLSAHAAAKYLRENYQKLNSWPLALTAYNHGATSMVRAQKAHGNYEMVFKHYENRRFGFASKNFYAEFLAARRIAKNYKKYFKNLPIDSPIEPQSVTLKEYASVEDLARHFDTDIETIKSYNPALRKPIFAGQKYVPKGYALKLPKTIPIKLTQVPDHIYKHEQKRSRFYRVERGDTAGKIAMMHKVRLSALKDINQLGRRATIYVGQNLRIPSRGEGKAQKLAAISTAKEIKTTKLPETAVIASLPPKKIAAAGNTVNSTPPPKKVTQEARFSMLSAHGKKVVTVLEIDLQKSHDNFIEDGDEPAAELKAAKIDNINPAIVLGNFMIDKVYSENGLSVGIAQAEYLETLGHYADWLEVPTQEIRHLNKFSFLRSLRAHQPIKLPLNKVSKSLFEERRYEFHKEIEEDFFSAYRVVGLEDYNIKKGDNIWTLSIDELDLPFWLIMKYNPITDFESLRPNQKIIVPIVEKV